MQDYLLSENRFKMLTKSKPEEAKKFFAQAQTDADRRWKFYQYLAARDTKAGRLPACRGQTRRQRGSTTVNSCSIRLRIAIDAVTDPGPRSEIRSQRQSLTLHAMDLNYHYLGLKLRTPLVASRLAAFGGDRQYQADGRRRRRGGCALFAL